MSVEQVSSHSISLSWASPYQEQLNGELTHYIVAILEQDTNTSTHTISTSTGAVLDFLHPFYTYAIRVSAVTVLPGPYSPELSITTLQDGINKFAQLHVFLPFLGCKIIRIDQIPPYVACQLSYDCNYDIFCTW